MKISVVLEALTSTFSTDLDRSARNAEKRMQQMQNTMSSQIGRVNSILGTLGIGLGLGALVGFTKSAIASASATKDLADSLGLTTEKFSGLNYAALQNGLSQEELGKALFKINNLLSDGAEAGSKAADSLAKFGITSDQIRSGAVGTQEAIKIISDRFNAMPNGIEKSALASEILGDKLAQKMIPFLNLGSKSLEEIAKQGVDAGAVLTDFAAKKVKDANDKLDAFAQTLKNKVVVALADFLNMMQEIEENADIETLGNQIDYLNRRLADVEEKGDNWLTRLFGRDAEEDAKKLREEIARLTVEYDKLAAAQMKRIEGDPVEPKGKDKVAPVALSSDEIEKRAKAQEEIAIKIRKLNVEVIAAADAQAIAQRESDDAYILGWWDRVDAQTDAEAVMEGLTEELYADMDAQERAAVDAYTEAWHERVDATEEAASEMTVFMEEAARNMQSSFADFLFDPFKDGVDGMLKGFADMLRKMAAELAAQALLKSLFSAMAGSETQWIASLGTALIGKKASGGPVSGGTPYIVGEEGPELFMPKMSGTIIPNGGWGGRQSVSIAYNVDARGADPASAANMMRALQQSSQDTERRVYEALRRNTAPV